jgi:hypothetical protein
MPLQIGQNDQGRLSGSIGGVPFQGFWDEDGQKVMLFTNPGGQMFVGYLFSDRVNLTGVPGSAIFTLAGYAETFAISRVGPPATSGRSMCGWYAQLGVG